MDPTSPVRNAVRGLVNDVFEPYEDFVPAQFLAAAEGCWYDPSDPRTVFQDHQGTTPAVPGDPVGLILDKSVLNGKDPTGTNLWDTLTPTVGTDYTDNGDGSYTYDGSNVSDLLYVPAGVGTDAYVYVQVTISGYTSGSGLLQSFGADNGSVTLDGNGTYVARLRRGNGNIGMQGNTLNNGCVISNFVTRWLPGHHCQNGTAAERPTLQIDSNGAYYLDFDGTDDKLYPLVEDVDYDETRRQFLGIGMRYDSNSPVGYQGTWRLLAPGAGYDTTSAVEQELYAGQSGGYAQRFALVRRNGGTVAWYDNNTYTPAGGASEPPHIRWVDWNAEQVGANLVYAGPTNFLASSNTRVSTAYPILGVGFSGDHMDGRLYQLVWLNKSVSLEERERLVRFIAAKCGLAV